MRLATVTLSVAALCTGIALSSISAAAEETGSPSNCLKLADEVNQALAANPQSSNHEAAVKEKFRGQGFCANGMYGDGLAHYEHALKLLGVSGR
ncbi:MAG TPA: hypothetical protein VHX61_07275 [Rhizomicrobium sp.]|jgi:hypothetical protein|nr:hypothetical protein [Rhizomicrobium sp.]